jgi:hypothetical protein
MSKEELKPLFDKMFCTKEGADQYIKAGVAVETEELRAENRAMREALDKILAWSESDNDPPQQYADAMLLARQALQGQAEEWCEWTWNEDFWECHCGQAFVCYEGTPTENKFIFCPYCGKKIKEINNG